MIAGSGRIGTVRTRHDGTVRRIGCRRRASAVGSVAFTTRPVAPSASPWRLMEKIPRLSARTPPPALDLHSEFLRAVCRQWRYHVICRDDEQAIGLFDVGTQMTVIRASILLE